MEQPTDQANQANNAPAEQNAAGAEQQDWAKSMLYQIASEALRENQRQRRWRIFMRLVVIAFVLTVLFTINLGKGVSEDMIGGSSGAHIGVVELRGIISSELEASSDNVIENLEEAFANEQSVAVMLRINSPGGSPVESGRINDAIVRLREEYSEKKIYTVVDEICASGGYYIAAASDEIYADKASVVGSIGVVSGGFGFVGLMEKLGVERRLHTAGENKAILDPFSEQKQQDTEHLQTILDNIHRQFVDVVVAGRGERLQGDEQAIFSGLFWDGEQALELGLIDYLGDSRSLKDRISEERDEELELVLYDNIDPVERLFKGLGASMASAISNIGAFSLY